MDQRRERIPADTVIVGVIFLSSRFQTLDPVSTTPRINCVVHCKIQYMAHSTIQLRPISNLLSHGLGVDGLPEGLHAPRGQLVTQHGHVVRLISDVAGHNLVQSKQIKISRDNR